jgi:TM2 domain-containing membrane protein YozV
MSLKLISVVKRFNESFVLNGNGEGARAMFCIHCGAEFDGTLPVCPLCGTTAEPFTEERQAPAKPPAKQRSRLAAGLLAIFLGYLGMHSFYLGYKKKAVVQIVVSAATCFLGGIIWGIADAANILSGGLEADADGVPLGE